MFEQVSAVICLETVAHLTGEQTRTLLQEIAGKTGIKWIESSDGFLISGGLKEVQISRTYLQQGIDKSSSKTVVNGEGCGRHGASRGG